MKQTQRHDAIIDLVRRQGYVSTEELVEHFDVSPQTIRRDLNDLAEQNKIQRHHGGAALPSSSENTAWQDRKMMWSAEKARIAQRVASQIPDGASLFIDIGTTPEAVAHALMNHSNLRIVTNNLNVAVLLMAKPDFRLILAGAKCAPVTAALWAKPLSTISLSSALITAFWGSVASIWTALCWISTTTKSAPNGRLSRTPAA